MKKSFTLLEIILVIVIISIVSFFLQYKISDNSLNELTNRMIIYLKEARYKAMIDSKKTIDDSLWHKERWTLKFFRCSKSVGGLYYVIYSDENKKGHPSFDEALRDPITKKAIYSTNRCEVKSNRSKYVLLTEEFDIKDVHISCNSTSSLGQISFGDDGKVYLKLSSYEYQSELHEIKEPCYIKLVNKDNNSKTISIEPQTGFISAIED